MLNVNNIKNLDLLLNMLNISTFLIKYFFGIMTMLQLELIDYDNNVS